MPEFEYKVVPAPTRGEKAKGVKTPEARFALALEQLMNQLAAEGWEYLRADMLPSEERQGLTGTTTNWRNMLVFRRATDESQDLQPQELSVAPPERKDPPPLQTESRVSDEPDGDVAGEGPSTVTSMTAALKARAAASMTPSAKDEGD